MQEEIRKTADEILSLVGEGKLSSLRPLLSEMNPADLAEIMDELKENELPLVYRILPKELASEVFSYMEPDLQELLIRSFSDRELAAVIKDMYLDDTVDMIEEMPASVVVRILQNTDPAARKQINELLQYPQDSAGSLMTLEYVSLREDMTVEEAFARIRREGVDKETVYTCYVTNRRRLVGIVTVKDLLLADYETKVSEIMTDSESVISVGAYEDRDAVVQAFSKYDLMALPVVDKEDRILGIVTVDDAVDVMEEEATEDIEKMAAIIPTDKPYFKTGIFETFRKRFPWLMLLMVSATFTGGIITSFEGALGKFPVLVAFIPMLMGTGGNAGGQASVTIIRGLALGEIEMRQVLRVIWKELRVALVCGIALAVAGFLKIILIDNLIMGTGVSMLESVTVCVTMLLTVIVSKIFGGLLPVVAKRMGFDPAVMASPFITTLVDAISLLIYFTVASLILPM